MLSTLNPIASNKHLTGIKSLFITNTKIDPKNKPATYTIHLNHHQPGDFKLKLDADNGYVYIVNMGPSSLDFRLNNQSWLSHIQKYRAFPLLPKDQITIFIPYIDNDNNSNSDQLKITLNEDLSFLFELS